MAKKASSDKSPILSNHYQSQQIQAALWPKGSLWLLLDANILLNKPLPLNTLNLAVTSGSLFPGTNLKTTKVKKKFLDRFIISFIQNILGKTLHKKGTKWTKVILKH